MSGYGKAHADWLMPTSPTLRAPFVCEEALLAHGSFSLMQRRGRRTGVPWGRPREREGKKADAYP